MELTSGNDHVRFLGAQPRSVVISELRSAQIFSLPCIVTPPEWPRAGRHDGLPLAILEAMAVGVPVISSSIGGIPAAISNDVTGILCRPGNVDDVAEALMDLMLDCGKRERLSGEARAYVEMQHNPNRN